MFRIGTDIIRISRIEKSLEKESFKLSVFTDNEIFYSKKPKPLQGFLPQKRRISKQRERELIKDLIQ